MKILTRDFDQRIKSLNILVECTFGEYLKFAKEMLKNNSLQRNRVKSSKSVYSLLRKDLQMGCIIPPLVLATCSKDIPDEILQTGNEEKLYEYINNKTSEFLILDGLQRTYTLIDAEYEIDKDKDTFYKHIIRFELYVNINKFGVLYRMLTLNAGQTPMSLRHQMEMLYSDRVEYDFGDIKLLRDTEGKIDIGKKKYSLYVALDGFDSYISRSELPIDRQGLLDNISKLENMANENSDGEPFEEFVKSYGYLIGVLNEVSDEHKIGEEELEEYQLTQCRIGSSAIKIFSDAQAWTAFGAALGRFKDSDLIEKISDIDFVVSELSQKEHSYIWLIDMQKQLNYINATARKIGNANRAYLMCFFRSLLDKNSDSYLNLRDSVNDAMKKYRSQFE